MVEEIAPDTPDSAPLQCLVQHWSFDLLQVTISQASHDEPVADVINKKNGE